MKNESKLSNETTGWGFHLPAAPRPQERFIYDYDALRVIEIVSRDEQGNLLLSSGVTVGPAEGAGLKFSASPLDALYRAREQFLENEYQSMMHLSGCDVGGEEGDRVLEHLKWVRDNLDAINRAIDESERS